jgi:hypothetical protein
MDYPGNQFLFFRPIAQRADAAASVAVRSARAPDQRR